MLKNTTIYKKHLTYFAYKTFGWKKYTYVYNYKENLWFYIYLSKT